MYPTVNWMGITLCQKSKKKLKKKQTKFHYARSVVYDAKNYFICWCLSLTNLSTKSNEIHQKSYEYLKKKKNPRKNSNEMSEITI